MQGGVTQQHLQPFLRKMPTTLQSAWEVWVKEVKPYEELRQQKRIRRECPSAVCCMLLHVLYACWHSSCHKNLYDLLLQRTRPPLDRRR